MKTSTRQKEVIKRKLLNEAAKQFAKNGFEGTNINDISTEAGFAKGTIYNYFQSKEQLFYSTVEEAAKLAVRRYQAGQKGISVKESLRRLVEADVSVFRDEEDFIKVLVGEIMRPTSSNYALILSDLGPFIENTSNILEGGIESGEIRKDIPPTQLSLVFLGFLVLLYVQHWKTDGGWPSLEEIPDLLVTLFMDGAGAPGSEQKLFKPQ